MSSFLKNKNLSYKESHYYYFADEETEPQKTICLKVTTEERGSTQKKKNYDPNPNTFNTSS